MLIELDRRQRFGRLRKKALANPLWISRLSPRLVAISAESSRSSFTPLHLMYFCLHLSSALISLALIFTEISFVTLAARYDLLGKGNQDLGSHAPERQVERSVYYPRRARG